MIFSPVVIAPTFNNEKTLGDIVSRIKMLGLPLIVVNDGSTDQTAEVLAAARTEFVDEALLHVLTHPRNCGKAAALRSGFQAAIDHGYSHAVTIDTDGQHDPEQIPQLLRIGQDDPTTLLLGVRSKAIEGYPTRSMLGRRLSNLLVWLESRVWVQDSQCGLRLYPLELIRRVSCRTNRFNFETEIITRAAWAQWRITEVPITSRYFPPEQRVSHFNPWLDTLRSIRMHIGLLGRALIPWRRSP